MVQIKTSRSGPPVEVVVEVEFPIFFKWDDYPDHGGQNTTWERIEGDGSQIVLDRREKPVSGDVEWSIERSRVSVDNHLGYYLRPDSDWTRIDTEEFNTALAEMALYVAVVPGAPPLSRMTTMGKRTEAIPGVLARVTSGSGPDPRLDRDIKFLVLGAEAEKIPGTAKVTASIDAALLFAADHHPSNSNEMDILGDALARMAYCGWYEDRSLQHQLARYILVCLLNDILGDAAHEVPEREDADLSSVDPSWSRA